MHSLSPDVVDALFPHKHKGGGGVRLFDSKCRIVLGIEAPGVFEINVNHINFFNSESCEHTCDVMAVCTFYLLVYNMYQQCIKNSLKVKT